MKTTRGKKTEIELILILSSMPKVREEDSQNVISEPGSDPTEVNEIFPLASMGSELDH